ncbi:NinB protein [compost metagenome]
MELRLATESDRARLMGQIAAMDLSRPLSVTISDEKRSDASNRRMWGMLRDVARQVEWYGQHLKDEDWKHIFSSSVEKQRAVPGLDGGFVVLGLSTRKQSQKWFSDMFEVMEAFAAERGVKWTQQDHWQGRY